MVANKKRIGNEVKSVHCCVMKLNANIFVKLDSVLKMNSGLEFEVIEKTFGKDATGIIHSQLAKRNPFVHILSAERKAFN